ncbi:MAG: anaerobic ribonucleoside-triphosphate reductase [bacterium]
MFKKVNENAANRSSYVGYIHNIGESKIKKDTLNSFKKEWKELHDEGYIHIHDLDAHGLTYNCLTLNIINNFPYEEFNNLDEISKIMRVFNFIIDLFTNLGQEQSGGMAFANFDNELATIFNTLNISNSEINKSIIKSCTRELILWCNNNHTRMGQTSYYTTFNIGLADNELARFIAYTLVDEFENTSDLVFKPNIVFKVLSGVNLNVEDQNYYILQKCLKCTTKKMIPTYVLCDSTTNKDINPELLSIMGCRTRVVENIHGNKGAIGRGNIANVSINLPRLALEVESMDLVDDLEKFKLLKDKWIKVAENSVEIMLHRFIKLCELDSLMFTTNNTYQLWCTDFKNNSLKDIFKNGTFSLGFIGLSECIEVLLQKKYYTNEESLNLTYDFVEYMRDYCDKLISKYNLNFSLSASSGELISGRFIEMDKRGFNTKANIFSKGFYTNSFHVDVDSKMLASEKIKIEGKFHELSNGGCITYIELKEAPLGNSDALYEYLKVAIDSGTHYIGVNFPKDVCNECGCTGVFDRCSKCNSNKITRIRRVSGYLELLDGFTSGKKAEEKYRLSNGGDC